MKIQNPRLFQLVWIRPQPSTRAAMGFGRGPAGCSAFGFQLPLHLGHRTHDGEETAPCGGGGHCQINASSSDPKQKGKRGSLRSRLMRPWLNL